MLRKRRAFFVVLCFIGLFAGIRACLKRYFAGVVSCESPCSDAVTCDPLRLKFELVPKTVSMKHPQQLWYRAELVNQSCRRLEGLNIEGFLDSKVLDNPNSGLSVSIVDKHGDSIKRQPFPRPDGGIAWNYGNTHGVSISKKGTIYPYRADSDALNRLRVSKSMGELPYTSLRPGESISNVPFRLRPYRIVALSASDGDGMTDGVAHEDATDSPAFPPPPEGFALLDRFTFDRQGQYMVKARYSAKVRIYSVYSRWERVSTWITPFLVLIGVRPENRWQAQEREITVTAPPIMLEILR